MGAVDYRALITKANSVRNCGQPANDVSNSGSYGNPIHALLLRLRPWSIVEICTFLV